MNGYLKTFKVKDGDKDINNKLMYFCIDDEKLLKNIDLLRLRLKHGSSPPNFRGGGTKNFKPK